MKEKTIKDHKGVNLLLYKSRRYRYESKVRRLSTEEINVQKMSLEKENNSFMKIFKG